MAEGEPAEPAHGQVVSYRTRRIRIPQWTSLGVIAIASASIGAMTFLTLLAELMLNGSDPDDWVAWIAGLSILVFSPVGAITGLLAILSGTADVSTRHDARLGIIALSLVLLPWIVLALWIMGVAFSRL